MQVLKKMWKRWRTKQVAKEDEEEEHSVVVPINFDEKLKFIEKWLEIPNYDEDCTEVAANENKIKTKLEENPSMPRLLSNNNIINKFLYVEGKPRSKQLEQTRMKMKKNIVKMKKRRTPEFKVWSRWKKNKKFHPHAIVKGKAQVFEPLVSLLET